MEHRQYLLGIDVGTTGTKTLLFDSCGKLLGRSYRAYPTHTPAVGRCEQQAEHWWAAVCETVRELCIDPEIAQRVSAISLSTQGGTVVPVDDSAAALSSTGTTVPPCVDREMALTLCAISGSMQSSRTVSHTAAHQCSACCSHLPTAGVCVG